MNEIRRACTLAAQYHKGQKYGEVDYMVHLHDVAASCDYNVAECVAWLHDILEDTDCTEEILREHFSDEVVDAVVCLTKVSGQKYENYITIVKSNELALYVKIRDTRSNLKASIECGNERWMRKYAKQYLLLTEDV